MLDSEWLMDLNPAARWAWTCLLLHVKSRGNGGRAKALTARVAASQWSMDQSDVSEMLDAAHEHGALNGEADEWRVTNWATYNPLDHNSADRQARYRDRQRNGDHDA